jgi:hypothetical protein
VTSGSDGSAATPGGSHDIDAARALTASAAEVVRHSSAFGALPIAQQQRILGDLASVRRALEPDPYAFALAAERRRNPLPGFGDPSEPSEPAAESEPSAVADRRAPPATETIAARAGALLDEIDFASFVAGLVHGTFDAVVDSSIRQLEAFGDLVASVAKTADQFTSENVTDNQARDWLVERYPADLHLLVPADGVPQPILQPRVTGDDDPPSPAWLAEFGLDGEELTTELIEEQLVPQARRRLGNDRLQTLATMVLLGMNRVVVRDGSISAKLRFRAAAQDRAVVDYAVSQDPGGSSWGTRGNSAYSTHTTMVSTVGVNAQTDAQLRADLFGEVRLNFESETLPLEQFADAAQRALLQRNARWSASTVPGAGDRAVDAAGPAAAVGPAPVAPPTPDESATPTRPADPAAAVVPPAAAPVVPGVTQ